MREQLQKKSQVDVLSFLTNPRRKGRGRGWGVDVSRQKKDGSKIYERLCEGVSTIHWGVGDDAQSAPESWQSWEVAEKKKIIDKPNMKKRERELVMAIIRAIESSGAIPR